MDSTLPPPIPGSASPCGVIGPDNKIIPGTETLTREELLAEIQAGGRFVCVPCVISILVLTFTQHSRLRFLRPGQDNFGTCLSLGLVSMVFGWWGFPFGLIRTPWALFKCAAGGKDLTRDYLAQLTGDPSAAAQALKLAKPRRRGFKGIILPLVLVGPLLALVVGLPMLAENLGERSASLDRGPEARSRVSSKSPAFENADRQIARYSGNEALGNTPEAKAIAANVASSMTLARENFFTGENRGRGLSKGHFITWCEVRGTNCTVMVHVPDLRKFSSEAKATMCELVWASCQKAITSKPELNISNLAVATRGALLYDRYLEGPLTSTTPLARDSGVEDLVSARFQ